MSPILDSIGSVKGFGWGSFVQITNSFDSIATITVSNSSTNLFSFTSIPSTYEHLQIRGIVGNSSGNFIDCKLNSDNAGNYAYHMLYNDGASVLSTWSADRSNFPCLATGVTSTINSGIIIDILDYKNTNKFKTIRTFNGWENNSSGTVQLISAHWRNTNAINSVSFFATNGNFTQNSTFALYGIKGVA